MEEKLVGREAIPHMGGSREGDGAVEEDMIS
jgi:hypothetical protein